MTGHTGFKGSWLTMCLERAGAIVTGYSLNPPTTPSLFESARVQDLLALHIIGDVRDIGALTKAVHDANPDIVFHLAAQPLVRYSYQSPVETYAVNVMGTVNLYEAVRAAPNVGAVVNITTDKCYENQEWYWGYRETEPLGGYDPYSSSKACAELVAAAYRRSFFAASGIRTATARAGNVIGGGDWASDRLIPDFFRAAFDHRSLDVRNPGATRPWQHVLEPIHGYMLLGERLFGDDGEQYASAWNFGPSDDDVQPVGKLLDQLCSLVPGASWRQTGGENPHEAGLLKLDSSKAKRLLGWSARWPLRHTLEKTASWYRTWREDGHTRTLSVNQIRDYAANSSADLL